MQKVSSMNKTPEILARKTWMATLAKAPAGLLADAWRNSGIVQNHTWLRAPEIGTVMVQGAMGATGSGFNLGEMTVTRCSLQLENGTVGHAYISGRDREKAEIAAMCDALLQTDAASVVRRKILDPMRVAFSEIRTLKAAKAAATKVDFFTLARGED